MRFITAHTTPMVFVIVALHSNLFINIRTEMITLKADSVTAVCVLTVPGRTVGSIAGVTVATKHPVACFYTGNKVTS